MLKSCSVFFVKIMIPLMTMQMCISSLVLPLESSFNASTLTRTVHLELQFKSGVNFINMLMLAQLKVHRSKGMALTIVYVQPPKISQTVKEIKSICLYLLTAFYLTQPSSIQIICFDFKTQDSALPYNIIPWCSFYERKCCGAQLIFPQQNYNQLYQ